MLIVQEQVGRCESCRTPLNLNQLWDEVQLEQGGFSTLTPPVLVLDGNHLPGDIPWLLDTGVCVASVVINTGVSS